MRRPPRLVARTLAVTFVTVVIILSVVFIVLTLDARDRVRTAETEKLRVAEQVFTALEARRQQDQLATIGTLTENPTLKAALDTYFTENRFSGLAPEQERSLRQTVARETEKLAALTSADVLAIVDTEGRIFSSAGPSRELWPPGQPVQIAGGLQPTFQGVVALPGGAFRVSGAALSLDGREIGELVEGTSLDANYAQELSNFSSAGVVITVNERVIARTVPEEVAQDLVAAGLDPGQTRTLNGEEYAISTLLASGGARIHTLTSIDAAARAATRDALTSARAYRPARAHSEAVAELRRYSGTQFDPASVNGLLAALPVATTTPEPVLQELLGRQLV